MMLVVKKDGMPMQETWRDAGSIPGLGRSPWRKKWGTHSKIFACRGTVEETGRLQKSKGLQKCDMTETDLCSAHTQSCGNIILLEVQGKDRKMQNIKRNLHTDNWKLTLISSESLPEIIFAN